MLDRFRRRLACLLVAFALSPWLIAAAADPPAAQKDDKGAKSASKADDAELQVDDELLEFLGSVDSEDGELIDYYARTDKATPDETSSAPAGSKAKPAAKNYE
jgi:hypothetical protein